MWILLKSMGLLRWDFWKSREYIVWRLHTAYGTPYQAGFLSAIRLTIIKIGFKRFLKDAIRLNRWLKNIRK